MTHNVEKKIAQPFPPCLGFPLVNQLTNQNILLVSCRRKKTCSGGVEEVHSEAGWMEGYKLYLVR